MGHFYPVMEPFYPIEALRSAGFGVVCAGSVCFDRWVSPEVTDL